MLETFSNSLEVDFSALDHLFEDRAAARPVAVIDVVAERVVESPTPPARFAERIATAAPAAEEAPALSIEEDWRAHDLVSLATLFRRSVATTLPFLFADLLALSLSGLLPYAGRRRWRACY